LGEVSSSHKIRHTHTHTHSAGLLRTIDQHVAEATTNTKVTEMETPVSMPFPVSEYAIPGTKPLQTYSSDRTAGRFDVAM